MEIPSSRAGVVKELKVKLGDKISEGTPLLMLEAAEAAEAAGTGTAPPKRARSARSAADTAPKPAQPTAAPAPRPGRSTCWCRTSATSTRSR